MSAHRKKLVAAGGALVLLAAAAGLRYAQARPDSASAKTAQVQSFAKGPYLQALGTNAVTIKLEVPAASSARIEVRPAGDAAAAPIAAASDADRTFHALRVEGLRPDTAYEYIATAGVASARGRFTTAPIAPRPFRFLVYGDNRSDAAAHAAVVRTMTTVPADFLVNTGDLVAHGPLASDWTEFFDIERDLLRDRCVFASVGNHELYLGSHDGEVAFLRYFGGVDDGRDAAKLYGTFRWSNTRFFVLNAMDTWTGAERDWLRVELDRALREPGLVHRVAVMHHGPFSAGRHGNNPALAKNGVVDMMRERKVDLVLAGHDHDYERGEGNGVKYIVSGGGGAPLYKKTHEMAETRAFEQTHHFVEVSVDGERLEITARRPTGAVIESCGYVGAGPWDCDAARPTAGPASASAPAPLPAPVGGPAKAGVGCGCGVPGTGSAGSAAALALALALAAARRRR